MRSVSLQIWLAHARLAQLPVLFYAALESLSMVLQPSFIVYPCLHELSGVAVFATMPERLVSYLSSSKECLEIWNVPSFLGRQRRILDTSARDFDQDDC